MSEEARTVTEKNAADLAEWCGGRLVTEHDALDENKTSPGINVPVWGGAMVKRAHVGDTIVRQSDGTFQLHEHNN